MVSITKPVSSFKPEAHVLGGAISKVLEAVGDGLSLDRDQWEMRFGMFSSDPVFSSFFAFHLA